jgi:hypothetical protein
VPWDGKGTIGYDSFDPAGNPLIADDGDVSVIAAHATRMAVDLLLNGTLFPYSMYVLSLKQGWLFEQPFEAYPIRGTEPFIVDDDTSTPSEHDWTEAVEFISQLIGASSHEAPPARQN